MLSLNQKVIVKNGLPRLVRGADIVTQAQGAVAYGKIVSLDVGVGKMVGVELDMPADGYAFYDAHSCDGAAKDRRGWWTIEENVEIVE